MKLFVVVAVVALGGMATVSGKPVMAQTGAAATASSGPVQPGIQILSDTQGVDFSAYLRRVHNDVVHNWEPLIPREVQAPTLKKGVVGIRFTILPDGSIGSMRLETPSGDVAMDKAAWYALTSEGKFPPLPKEFHGPQLELRVGFFYNEAMPVQASQSGAVAQ